MKKSTVTISYDEEKLNALRIFLTQKNLDLGAELTGVCDALFKKYVPSSVQSFLELKDAVTPDNPVKKPLKAVITGTAPVP